VPCSVVADIWWALQACGWPSWLSLLVGLGAFVLSAVAIVTSLARARAAALRSWLAVAIAVLPTGVGAAGMAIGRSQVNRLIAGGFADPSQLTRIREEGYHEAGACLTVGGASSVLPLLLAFVALTAAYGVRDR
jgi:hypothetical protein